MQFKGVGNAQTLLSNFIRNVKGDEDSSLIGAKIQVWIMAFRREDRFSNHVGSKCWCQEYEFGKLLEKGLRLF
jgi:hypothetical protein